jgi:hypothetical protein
MNTRAWPGPLLATVIWAALLACVASAQTPLSELQFSASHNAYQRSHPEDLVWTGSTNILTITDQLDSWNVWHMEWDVFWHSVTLIPGLLPGTVLATVEANPKLALGHAPQDSRGFGSLDSYLSQLAGTQRIQDGFVVMKLQMTDALSIITLPQSGILSLVMPYRGSSPKIDFPTTYETLIKNKILAEISAHRIYTQADFVADDLQWPSPEELIGRGKHVAFYLDTRADDEADRESLFLTEGDRGSYPDSATWNLGTASTASDPLVASYRFPEDLEENDANWSTAMNMGHNFVGTTKLGERVGNPYFHPPLPTHVKFGGVCSSGQQCGNGTWRNNDRGPGDQGPVLLRAISRVEDWEATTGKRSTIQIRMRGTAPGLPIVLTPTGDRVISASIVLINATNADVVLD